MGNTGSHTFAGCRDSRMAETNWLPSVPLESIIMVQNHIKWPHLEVCGSLLESVEIYSESESALLAG